MNQDLYISRDIPISFVCKGIGSDGSLRMVSRDHADDCKMINKVGIWKSDTPRMEFALKVNFECNKVNPKKFSEFKATVVRHLCASNFASLVVTRPHIIAECSGIKLDHFSSFRTVSFNWQWRVHHGFEPDSQCTWPSDVKWFNLNPKQRFDIVISSLAPIYEDQCKVLSKMQDYFERFQFKEIALRVGYDRSNIYPLDVLFGTLTKSHEIDPSYNDLEFNHHFDEFFNIALELGLVKVWCNIIRKTAGITTRVFLSKIQECYDFIENKYNSTSIVVIDEQPGKEEEEKEKDEIPCTPEGPRLVYSQNEPTQPLRVRKRRAIMIEDRDLDIQPYTDEENQLFPPKV